MPGLVPGIHVFAAPSKKDVDGRDEPGHDEIRVSDSTPRNTPYTTAFLAIASRKYSALSFGVRTWVLKST
jgi:hypothetical protein